MGPDKPPSISISSIVVEGLDADLIQKAEAEIRVLLAPLEQAPLDLAGEVDLSVLVSDRMAEHVDRIGREHGLQSAPYRREKETVAAGGIVLTAPGGPPFRITVVLHNDLWAHSDDRALVERAYMLAYMFVHVVKRGRGEEPKWRPQGHQRRTHADAVRSAAAAAIDAVDADCTAVALCRYWLTCADGSPLPFSGLLGERFVASAHELGEKLSVFATIDVQFYRLTAVGLEDLYPRVGPLLGETMLVFMHALALFTADDRVEALMEALGQSAGLRAYVLPDAEAIRSAIAAEDPAEREAQMVAALERILLRLGLRLEDQADGGLYVHVSQPVLCPIALDSAAG